MKKLDITEVRDYINSQSQDSKIYIGADSESFFIGRELWADFTLAIVVHRDGKHGCKVFGEVHRERVYDTRKDRPALRLMAEVYKLAELFQRLQDVLVDRDIEIHLDMSRDKRCGSSCVVEQAIGYVRGVCGVEPRTKPQAWAASSCADRLKLILESN